MWEEKDEIASKEKELLNLRHGRVELRYIEEWKKKKFAVTNEAFSLACTLENAAFLFPLHSNLPMCPIHAGSKKWMLPIRPGGRQEIDPGIRWFRFFRRPGLGSLGNSL